MHENTGGRVTFLVNLMFCRLDKLDGPIFEKGGVHTGGLIFGMLTGLHTWGVYIREGLYMGGRGVLTAFYEMWESV